MLIRSVTSDLYSEIFRLQNEVHPSYLQESMTVLTSKVYVSPDTCFAVQDGGEVIGYILSIPLPEGEIPPLDDSVDPAENPSVLLIHDCAVSPSRRKSGIAAKMIHAVETIAIEKGFKKICLVAVHGASAFWSRHGWEKTTVPVPQEYGEAVYMTKIVG